MSTGITVGQSVWTVMEEYKLVVQGSYGGKKRMSAPSSRIKTNIITHYWAWLVDESDVYVLHVVFEQ